MARDDEGNGDGNGNGGLPGIGHDLREQITAILIHVGETRKGIRGLERGQTELKDTIEALREASITRSFCEEKHGAIQRQFLGVERELDALRKKTGTGVAHPAVPAVYPHHDPYENTGPFKIPTAESAVEEVLEKKQERRRNSLTFYLSAAGGTIAIISALTVGIVKLVHLIDKVENTAETSVRNAANQVEKARQELSEEIAARRIVHIRIPVAPDAGPPATPPKRAPKRRIP